MPDTTTTNPPYDLYGGTPPHVSGSATSRDAALFIKPHVGSIAHKIYEIIARAGLRGCTVDELEEVTDGLHHTVGPRVREMVQTHLLRATENERRTRSGRPATVYVTSALDPRPSVRTKTDWKEVALELFELLAQIETAFESHPDDTDMHFVAQGLRDIATKRHEFATVDASGNLKPVKKP